MRLKFLLIMIVAFSVAESALSAAVDVQAGQKAERSACVPCHSLRLVESQRLSPAAWQKEVDKMIGWGAVVPNRQLLIDYLSEQYGTARPPAPVVRSTDSK